MIIVRDIIEDIRRVLGTCDDSIAFNRINEAVQLLKSLGMWDPGVGFMDICTDDCFITLPDDVDVPLAINVGGQPADFRNKWFEFHLNGPGSECCTDTAVFSWVDEGTFPTFRSIKHSSKIVAIPELPEDPSASIRIFGYDDCGKWIMTPDCTGTLVDGFEIPILKPGIPSTQTIKRITRVQKPVTRGFVRLTALDMGDFDGDCDDRTTEVLLGLFRPNETDPQFRRIGISGVGCDRLCDCTVLNSWVRMRFRKKHFLINHLDDEIFLHSASAIKMACMAIRKYEADLPDGYATYLALAKQALMNEQKFQSGPNRMRIQFDRGIYGSKVEENMI